MSARAAGDPPEADPRRRALAALSVTEIVSYGVIYYAFPVLASQITADTGWSRTAVTAAYSAGNLAGALTSVPAGRILQRHGPRLVMTASSVLGAASVAGDRRRAVVRLVPGRVAGRRGSHGRAVFSAGVRRADRVVRAAAGAGADGPDAGGRVRQHHLYTAHGAWKPG